MSDRQASCEERAQEHLESRLSDLRLLWAGYTGQECALCEGEGGLDCLDDEWEEVRADCFVCEGTGKTPEDVPDLGNLYEYGLSFDYVEAGTFNDQEEGFFCYLLSYGGPSDEFRFFVSIDKTPYKIEYWFLDWFDGACRTVNGTDKELLESIWGWFAEGGTVEAVYQKAVAGRHETIRTAGSLCYSPQWSGVSYAPHCSSGCLCPDCLEPLHLEGHDTHYCPVCDDFKHWTKGCENI